MLGALEKPLRNQGFFCFWAEHGLPPRAIDPTVCRAVVGRNSPHHRTLHPSGLILPLAHDFLGRSRADRRTRHLVLAGDTDAQLLPRDPNLLQVA